jgi:ABC-2 type transport system ATP-binding protein
MIPDPIQPPAAAPVLQASGLVKRFGSLTAVDHLDLEVREGEVFGFLGPNGAGKTTSISMLCGLLRPDAGEVRIHGERITGGSPAVRARVGVCPQEIVIWERLTCQEQLEFTAQMYNLPPAAARRNSLRLLEELDLAEKRSAQARTLSGGMKRRLNVALALVHDPEIVVFDEPEAGLDPQSRVRVREYIRSLARHKTVILTTHNMDEADRLADRVAIIDRGRLIVLDTPAALRASLGPGDVLEIGLDGRDAVLSADTAQRCVSLRAALQSSEPRFQTLTFDPAERLLRLRALDAVHLLPALLEALAAAGLRAGEVRLRPNTLEDVFIQLTGRRLRE